MAQRWFGRACVEDVDADQIVLFDGFTKNSHYPGWRCTCIVGPALVIDAASSSGSFLDGGGSQPLHRYPLFAPRRASPVASATLGFAGRPR